MYGHTLTLVLIAGIIQLHVYCIYHSGFHMKYPFAAIITVVLLFSPALLCIRADHMYWVRPSSMVPCPSMVLLQREQCITLNDIARNSTVYLTSNTTINFLPGLHAVTLHKNETKIVTASSHGQIYNLSLVGDTTQCEHFECKVKIECDNSSVRLVLVFANVSSLNIANIEIKGCGSNKWESISIEDGILPTASAAILLFDVSKLFMNNFHITDSNGYGLLAYNITETSSIRDCSFMFNHGSLEALGGNAYLNYPRQSPANTIHIKLLIANSIFSQRNGPQSAIADCCERYSSGLKIKMPKSYRFIVKIQIRNSTFSNNAAFTGANLHLVIPSHPRVDITIHNCSIIAGNASIIGGGLYLEFRETINIFKGEICYANLSIVSTLFKSNHAQLGGGLAVTIQHQSVFTSPLASSTTLNVTNCTFLNNHGKYGGGIHFNLDKEDSFFHNISETKHISLFQSVRFVENNALQYGGAISVFLNYQRRTGYSFKPAVEIFQMETCLFKGNKPKTGTAIAIILNSKNSYDRLLFNVASTQFKQNFIQRDLNTSFSGVIHLQNVQRFTLSNSVLHSNELSGLYLNSSIVHLQGTVIIRNNTATYGAGIYFDCSTEQPMSRIIIAKDSTVYINNNRANIYGGSIAITDGCRDKDCFYNLPNNSNTSLMILQNNTARIAGDEIYGENLDSVCSREQGKKLTANQFQTIFNLNRSTPSLISSQPHRVCFCNPHFRYGFSCPSEEKIHVYPGELLMFPVVGIGQYYYSSPSVIQAEIGSSCRAQIEEQETLQEVGTECQNLTYSIYTKERTVTLCLRIQVSLLFYTKLQHAILTVHIHDCPFGFEKEENAHRTSFTCVCKSQLREEGLTCNIATQTVHRPLSMWIGNYSTHIVVHRNCPFDYCKQLEMELDLHRQFEQCTFNRTGVLCGGCQPGQSLVLGSSQCTKCSNNHLLLLLPFALVGVFLIILLLKCNFTVSIGTINGLIFYANIAQASNIVSFQQSKLFALAHVLSTFIAWLNLDFGIEVCFVDKLNAYIRTWLQFIFPLYIWLLVGLLTLISRKSFKVSRWTGTNTVSVLATLFFLSYAKLLRTTLDIMSQTTLTHRDQSNITVNNVVWLIDGNYNYIKWPHCVLFFAALITLIIHLLPITVLILFAPLLQTYTQYKALHWVIKLLPLLDAYQGPYKTNYRYWTGFMLLVRVFLFSVFASNALGDPRINLMVVIFTILLLLIVWIRVGGVYKKTYNNVLEVFFLLNLGVYSTAALYLKSSTVGRSSQKKQAILSYIMVGSAFIVFVCIVVYHGYYKLRKSRWSKRVFEKVNNIVKRFRSQNERDITEEEEELTMAVGVDNYVVSEPAVSYIDVHELLSAEK